MGSSRVARWPHLGLRSVVTRPYAGITGAIEQPGGFVLPATASVLLVMKVEDPMLAEATRLGIDTDALVSLIRGAGSNNGGKSR